MSSIPRATALRFASTRRTNGYVDISARTGERGTATALDATRGEPHERVEGALELRDLDLLVRAVGELRRARPEVDRVEALRGELGHRGPGLLRTELERPR